MPKIQGLIQYPTTGSIVEFMLGNKPQPAFVLEEQKDSLRVLTLTKREMRLARNRVLPWSGPPSVSIWIGTNMYCDPITMVITNTYSAVEEVIKKGAFDLVFERGAVIDVKPQYDITRQVIERMNQLK